MQIAHETENMFCVFNICGVVTSIVLIITDLINIFFL